MLYFQAVEKDRYEHITDNELLEKFYSNKDNQWLGIVLQRYTLLLFGVCMKYLKNEESAKDAVQQIFLKSLTELSKYKVTYIKSWLYMVAKNHCLMKLRNKHVYLPIQDKTQILEDNSGWNEIAQKEITLTLLENSIEELNPEQKTCVILFYLHKKSYLEIVETTGFNLLQVKSFIQNGKRNLKIWVEKKMKNT